MIAKETIESIRKHYTDVAADFPWEEVAKHYRAIAETCDLALQSFESPWRSIDTAPNRTWILVADAKSGLVTEAERYSPHHPFGDLSGQLVSATHWMPMPPPPPKPIA